MPHNIATKIAPGIYEHRGVRVEARTNHLGTWWELSSTRTCYPSLQDAIYAVDYDHNHPRPLRFR